MTKQKNRIPLFGISVIILSIATGMFVYTYLNSKNNNSNQLKPEQKPESNQPETKSDDSLKIQQTKELAVDLSKVKTIDESWFTVSCPEQWQTESPDEERMFITTPGQQYIMFQHIKNADVSVFNSELEKMRKIIQMESFEQFGEWGQYHGQGMLLKGKLGKVYPGKIMVFYCKKGESAFLLTEVRYDEHEPVIKPGLDLLAETFKYKGENGE